LEKKFNTYNIFYNFSKSNEFFFNFDFILATIFKLNESIFTVKINKNSKKLKKITKNKFNLSVKYLRKNKRVSSVFKQLFLYSNTFNYYRFDERLLASILTTLLEQANSDIYKKKLYTYNQILKKQSFKI
jgi:hypothetical protein